ncbi:hypothetical protein TNIN_102011 [Trichonephila inaurata madagascariensis]|uniref:Uncharacterized protein n=1 Tax=Trichonephila inaurata madagascariensis TaxID=2747483 RepID=A0A8X6Y7Q4_9ARAC|nr:hypothetical protein TNIN_102011 [Trichonephila inaurata madagascariensis]
MTAFSFFSREDIQVAVEEFASLLSMTVELFGYIGGYLGVSLGISLLAVSDLLETLLLIFRGIRAAFKKRRLKKQDMIQRMHSCYHADSRGNFRLKIY